MDMSRLNCRTGLSYPDQFSRSATAIHAAGEIQTTRRHRRTGHGLSTQRQTGVCYRGCAWDSETKPLTIDLSHRMGDSIRIEIPCAKVKPSVTAERFNAIPTSTPATKFSQHSSDIPAYADN